MSCVFFFKQKTAYEMRISDWSSDVCSSDLLTRDYHVIAPDLPGFGQNERNPDLAYDLQAQTARLKAFADTLGLSRPHVGGNSMGGWIALRYAIEYPDALASLILLNNAGVNGANESELPQKAANGG